MGLAISVHFSYPNTAMSIAFVGERQITAHLRRLRPKCVETIQILLPFWRQSEELDERNLLFISPLHYERPNIGLVDPTDATAKWNSCRSKEGR